MKKRILCFLLSAAMLASVTACSGGGDASSEGSAPAGSGSNAEASQPADSSEPIELTVLNWGSDIDVKINQDAYARFLKITGYPIDSCGTLTGICGKNRVFYSYWISNLV